MINEQGIAGLININKILIIGTYSILFEYI